MVKEPRFALTAQPGNYNESSATKKLSPDVVLGIELGAWSPWIFSNPQPNPHYGMSCTTPA